MPNPDLPNYSDSTTLGFYIGVEYNEAACTSTVVVVPNAPWKELKFIPNAIYKFNFCHSGFDMAFYLPVSQDDHVILLFDLTIYSRKDKNLNKSDSPKMNLVKESVRRIEQTVQGYCKTTPEPSLSFYFGYLSHKDARLGCCATSHYLTLIDFD